ncbi:MAG: metallophosphatase family protein [Candidatus Methanoperedens sp.]|jgi:putative phosphoesterase|nr:metallophosphatase family protein [Candidatus Methanoperedens sp.]
MLIGLISDVHSNAVALENVLSILDEMGVEKILHAGDIIGYNPYPNETVELFKKNKIISILGNHERALISGDISDFNPYAAAALLWTRRVMSPENLSYIKSLKSREHMIIDKTRIVVIHGSPRDVDEYVFPVNVSAHFLAATKADVLVLGHTHVQFKKEYSLGTVLNPGSVGQPRDENPEAAFAVYDTATGETQLKRTGYNIEKVIEDMHSAHLPDKLGLRLRLGL